MKLVSVYIRVNVLVYKHTHTYIGALTFVPKQLFTNTYINFSALLIGR